VLVDIDVGVGAGPQRRAVEQTYPCKLHLSKVSFARVAMTQVVHDVFEIRDAEGFDRLVLRARDRDASVANPHTTSKVVAQFSLPCEEGSS
jgi:hypothetical protein